MKIATSDYFLARFSQAFPSLLRRVGDWETSSIESRLRGLKIVRPVFICGLARSGSTLLLELLSQVDGVATHRYRDFPFQSIPWLWCKYLDKRQSEATPVERPHADRIMITLESPEAMEEPLWMMFFKNLHSMVTSQALTGEMKNPEFAKFYDEHLRKILLIRGGDRYVSKNNYNVGRIEYLLQLYPDSQFVVPIRHPIDHVQSLARQHIRFSKYAKANSRIARYLRAAGHFEFGPQRLPVQFDSAAAARTLGYWRDSDDCRGYAVQWREVYGIVQRMRECDRRLSTRIHVVRYEDFCEAPEREFAMLLQRTGLADRNRVMLNHICASESAESLSTELRQLIWREVESVAASFDYRL